MTTEHDPYRELTDEFGADLQTAATRHAQRAPRGFRIAFAAGGLAVAGTAIALILGIGGPGKLDLVSQAQAALAPTAQILHTKMSFAVSGVQGAPTKPTVDEQWSASDPLRWRVASELLKPAEEKNGIVTKWRAGGISQRAYAGGASSDYQGGIIATTTGYTDDGLTGQLPSFGIQTDARNDGDQVAQIRALLAKGTLKDAGATTINGRPALRLAGTLKEEQSMSLATDSRPVGKDSPIGQATVVNAYEYDVDPTSYAPVRIQWKRWVERPADSTAPPSQFPVLTQTVDFLAYEHLEATPANVKLLKIQAPPGTKETIMTKHERLIDNGRQARKERKAIRAARAAARAKD